jgi:hypothetical protein
VTALLLLALLLLALFARLPLPVIPAKAGIQPLLLTPEKLDPSFRWDDGIKDDGRRGMTA